MPAQKGGHSHFHDQHFTAKKGDTMRASRLFCSQIPSSAAIPLCLLFPIPCSLFPALRDPNHIGPKFPPYHLVTRSAETSNPFLNFTIWRASPMNQHVNTHNQTLKAARSYDDCVH